MASTARKFAGGQAPHAHRRFYPAAARNEVRLGLSAVAAAVGLVLSAPVHSQQQPGAEAPTVEEIQVTGSRIIRGIGFTTPVPVTSLQMDELRDVDPTNTIAEQLDQLPQFFQNTSSQRGGHAVLSAGQSHINMRGVGINRTLVLLDGSRIVPSDRLSSVNVDYLPTALIQRVEVVTGGASAAYGADALAGVTNFILNRQFTGVEANIQGARTDFGDGNTWQAEVAFGTRVSDRFHVIGSVETRNIDAIRRGGTPDTVGRTSPSGAMASSAGSSPRARPPTRSARRARRGESRCTARTPFCPPMSSRRWMPKDATRSASSRAPSVRRNRGAAQISGVIARA